jgi:dTDP-4-amino-4,6-dideoxygalactose transaminase
MINKFSPWPSYDKQEANAARDILLSGKVNYWTGSECRKFEIEFSKWTEVKFSVSLSNGTVALEFALRALLKREGECDMLESEVIVTSRTFIASASSIVNVGAKPIFVDIDADSQNITVETIEAAITDRTRAIVCVHLAGWPCEMESIMELAEKYNLYVIEDCAQAHGAKYKGKSVGSIGDVGCWSFCQDKIMTTGGEGGMITTNNKEIWSKIWSYKDHGKSWESIHGQNHSLGFRWVHESFGTNGRMTEMQAAIGRIQLKRMDLWNKERCKNSKEIMSCFDNYPEFFRVPKPPIYLTHAWYKCYVFIRPEVFIKIGITRDQLIREFNENGIPCYSGSCSEVYLEKAFKDFNLRPKKRLPVAKELGETSLMFQVHPGLDNLKVIFDQKLSIIINKIKGSTIKK